MSWAAHEFENYFLQKHVGLKASFFGIVAGTFLPDLFTKPFVYAHHGDAAHFHRGWPGVGFTHSFIFGLFLAVVVLGLTRSRSWALGILIGQWAHVLTDVCDTAGVMPFFPFSTQSVSISMWKHAAGVGRHADGAGYYSSLGGIWDLAWFLVLILFAREVLRADYFERVVVPADAKLSRFLHEKVHLSRHGMVVIYRAYFLYGLGRMVSWFLYARFDVHAPWQPVWEGPRYLPATDLSDASWVEVVSRTAVGGALFVAFVALCWVLFIRRLWERGVDPESVTRGEGLRAAFH